MIFRSPKTLEELLEFFEITYCCNPSSMAFVCIEKKTGKVATLITLIACDTYHRKATIAMGIAFRGFWGTSFATLSAGLLLRYCFNAPLDAVPGLGLRRVQWTSHWHADNIASQKLARRLGLRFETEKRWFRVIPQLKPRNERALRAEIARSR